MMCGDLLPLEFHPRAEALRIGGDLAAQVGRGDPAYRGDFQRIGADGAGRKAGIDMAQFVFGADRTECRLIAELVQKAEPALDLQFFPDNYPRVFVVAPRLLTFSGAPLSPMRHDMHTNEPDPHGNPQICHSGATAWSPATSLTAVVLKCRIWLEAYEAHLRTGRTIAELLPSQAQVAPPRAAGGSGR